MDNLSFYSNSIKFLCADMVQKANSGHPGVALGLSDIMTILTKHININPKNPNWLNRDRVVFSGGHASSLVYSMFHLWGYDISLDDLKNFRQLGSITPGHPENGVTPGVEITTGPLGQGVANAVGFSMASLRAKEMLGKDIINHNVFCLCGDGDLQEGISYEALSLAGHLQLDNFILIYDSNNITIEGDTSLAWSEDVKKRFEAINFEIFEIDGHNFEQIDDALKKAKEIKKPVVIIANTIIAKGSATLSGSHKSHGAPLGVEDIKKSKQLAGFDSEKEFFIPDEVKKYFDKTIEGERLNKAWDKLVKEDLPLKESYELLQKLLNPNYEDIDYPTFEPDSKIATRDSNHKILNAIAKKLPGFLGGSADLAPSNKTNLVDMGDFPKGRNIHFGIREHAMGAITNGMNLYGLFRVFNSTFFVFSDYLKPSARVASISHIPNIFIFTHDSIGVGEDGATHQPIEQLSTFRAMPNFYTFRPADASENVECWKVALNLKNPCGFVLSRQKLRVLKDKKDFGDVSKGGYLLKKRDGATITLIASGSEVMLALQSACFLESDYNIKANVVSMPCMELFDEQDSEYKSKVIDKNTTVIAIEASSAIEYYKYADFIIGMDSFGDSANADDLFKKFGFTIDSIKNKVKDIVKNGSI